MDRDDYYYDDPEETKSRPTRQKVMAALAGFVLISPAKPQLSNLSSTFALFEPSKPPLKHLAS